uniref:AAA+ ATPase domain-containing protein n=1 Tax=Cyprinodon variegatus TaxID=28743 RepID=A0A3Q2FV27_CYPVA
MRRVTFGKKDKKKPNKTILLVGETGAGKTTLVNVMANYIMGVKFEDGVWFQITEDEEQDEEEEKVRRLFESQTSNVIRYEIFGFEGITLSYSLTIIDTPGFGNTQDITQDLFVSQSLYDLFRSEDGISEVDAVALVLKQGDNRLSDRLIYIFDSVMSLFGNDINNNIISIITHSNGISPPNTLAALKAILIKCARNEKDEPLHIMFDNCQHEERTDKTINLLRNADKISGMGMKNFSIYLKNVKPLKLMMTTAVLNERIRLAACIENLQDRINLIEMKKNEIQQTEKALKDHEKEMKMNENFIVEVDEPYTYKKPIDGGRRLVFFFRGAVSCKHCKETCHYRGCTLAWNPAYCEVMENGRCTVCKEKCLASAHVKDTWIYVSRTRKVRKTLEEMRKKYVINKLASAEAQNILKNLQQEKEKLEVDKAKWLCEAYEHVETLNKIALKVETVSTYVDLETLIEKMQNHDEEKCNLMREMIQNVDSLFKRAATYFRK